MNQRRVESDDSSPLSIPVLDGLPLFLVEQAVDLGFSEATNFVKFFKRIAGTTPEAFRREQRES